MAPSKTTPGGQKPTVVSSVSPMLLAFICTTCHPLEGTCLHPLSSQLCMSIPQFWTGARRYTVEVHDMGSRQVKSWKCNRSRLYAVMLHNAYIRLSSRKCRNVVFVQIDTNRIFSVFLCLLYPQYTVHVIIHDHTNHTIFLHLLCSLSVEFLHPPKKNLRQVAPETRFGGLGSRWPSSTNFHKNDLQNSAHSLRFLTTLQLCNHEMDIKPFAKMAWGSSSLVFKHQLLDCQSEEVGGDLIEETKEPVGWFLKSTGWPIRHTHHSNWLARNYSDSTVLHVSTFLQIGKHSTLALLWLEKLESCAQLAYPSQIVTFFRISCFGLWNMKKLGCRLVILQLNDHL